MSVDVDSTVMVYRSVICEIVDYIKDMYLCTENLSVFKLTHLTKVTAQYMTEMGVSTDAKKINRTQNIWFYLCLDQEQTKVVVKYY